MYKNQRIAVVFFARSKSSRLKNKLYKNISGNSILSINLKIFNNIKYIDEKIMATTSKVRDNKIVQISKLNNIKCYRGSEDNVLKRFYEACNSLEKKPDIVIRHCCENPLTSALLLEKNIKEIVNKNADLMSILPPSNLIFGISPIIMTFNTLKKIYKNAKNKIYKEHVENYCYDHKKDFNIFYPKYGEKYFFPNTNFSIDTVNDYRRVKNIFSQLKLENFNYDFGKIKKIFLKKKIFINDAYLYKYLKNNYKNYFNFTNNISQASYIINFSKKNKKKYTNSINFFLTYNKNKGTISCKKNNEEFNLIKFNKIKNFTTIEYFKMFFQTLIHKTLFWPPTDLDDLNLKTKNTKILTNNYKYKYEEYFPKKIITNKAISYKLDTIKAEILSNSNFINKIKNHNKQEEANVIYVYNNNFVYYENKIIKMRKFDIFLISFIWRSLQYSKMKKK